MSRDVSPTMTNTNTTPNDTDRTTERTRSTPRAPARALPRRALPPALPRPRVRPYPSTTDRSRRFFIVASPRAHHIDRLDREYEATDRSRRFFIVASPRAHHIDPSRSRVRGKAPRARSRSRRRHVSRVSTYTASIASETPSVWWSLVVYTSVYTYRGFCVYTTYRVSVFTHRVHASPRDRPPARARADVEAGTNADDAFDRAHVDARSVERELDAKTPFSSFVRRSIAERHRTRRACPRIHSFIHSEGG